MAKTKKGAAKAKPTTAKTNTEKVPVTVGGLEATQEPTEDLQPTKVEVPEIVENEVIIVNEGEVMNAPIDQSKEIIQHNEIKEEVKQPQGDVAKGEMVNTRGSFEDDEELSDLYETTDYRKLKRVTGKKQNLHGTIYVGIKHDHID